MDNIEFPVPGRIGYRGRHGIILQGIIHGDSDKYEVAAPEGLTGAAEGNGCSGDKQDNLFHGRKFTAFPLKSQ